ncbi:MAG: Asd/ArgC dimerization domain-containing protein [Acidobacteriaceae bacterium]|nr:Asd/ArgC dimerization domain-containing protein [Acidobacteriaceae bacterium]
MAFKLIRGVIVGASSALGKELTEQLTMSPASAWDLTLLDDGEAGQVTAAGEEAMIVLPLEKATFEGADVVFFASTTEVTERYWKKALATKAALVDLTGALGQEEGAKILAPSVGTTKADLETTVVLAAHPAAILMAMLEKAVPQAKRLVATILEPASQLGQMGMDELHAQTVALLSFQSLPKEVFGAQVAFTLRDELGSEAKKNLHRTRSVVSEQLRTLRGESSRSTTLQFLQAPIFHGYGASVWIDTEAKVSLEAMLLALTNVGIKPITDFSEEEEVTNQGVSGQADVLARVREDENGMGFWVWLVADNLHLTVRNAISSALELLELRPSATLQ